MKKIFAILMVVTVLGAFLAGCSGGGDSAGTDGTAAPAKDAGAESK
ncbi:MAG: hypothetical protein J0H02_03230 [Armatimonadetes bacterium]|nr:hypothetical protein [Armatimonadota bacterium]